MLSICVWGIALCLIIIPIVEQLWLLCIFILVPGFFCGVITIGLQAIILDVWGPEKSKPLVQSFHFMYTIGAFLGEIFFYFAKLIKSTPYNEPVTCKGKRRWHLNWDALSGRGADKSEAIRRIQDVYSDRFRNSLGYNRCNWNILDYVDSLGRFGYHSSGKVLIYVLYKMPNWLSKAT